MLTKKQCFVLDVLIEICPYGARFNAGTLYSKITEEDAVFDEVTDICASLENIGLVRDLKIGSTGIVDGLSLTYAGRHYKELRRLRLEQTIKEHVLTLFFGVIAGLILGVIL